jgi:hypothetical protein
MKSEIERIIEKGLKDYRVKPIKLSGKNYNLHIFSEDEDLNLFEGFLFAEPKEKSELSYLISRYRPPVSGYVPRLSLVLYNDQLILKDYRKYKHIRKTLRKINKTFTSKLKKALEEPAESNYDKLFDRTDIIEEFYILYKKTRDYLLENVKGISEEDRRLNFVDNFMMQMLTLWYLQEKGFFNNDNSYFITKFKELKQKKLSGGFDSHYQFLTYFFEKIKDGDTLYYKDRIVGTVVIIGPAIFLDSGDEEAITIPDKCFYKEGMTEVLINTAPKKVPEDVPLFNLFESRDWVEGDIDEFVLGALYEKLMTEDVRKKTGSYYTPEEITSYISKNTIEPYLVDRVNEECGSKFGTIDQIIETDDKDVLPRLFEQLKEIKVLDPAVGSAHFLESAINVLLAIYEKVWAKAKEKGLKRGLEIIAADEQGKIKPVNLLEISDDEQLRMFVKFFIILSKNVYGVDINPSAINIAKARLFLTIAKHFTTGKYFIRFPNVHFNLRTGNSLIGYVKKGEEKEEVKTERGQLSLDFFVKEKEATYIVESIKVVSGLRDYLIETAKTLGINGDILKEVKELNKILSKKEIKWGNFEKVLRTKEKLISILIASLNSQYARPLNELLNKITELFNQKLDEKFADEYNIDLAELKEIKTFHWDFEFPEVFWGRGGFDVVVGNPPYGDILNDIELKIIGFEYEWKTFFTDKESKGSKNSASIFVERSYSLTRKNGNFAMILPNSMERIPEFSKIRDALLNEALLYEIVDEGFPFSGSNLEMATIFYKKQKLDANYYVGCISRKIKGKWAFGKYKAKELKYFPLYYDEIYEYIRSLKDVQFGDVRALQGRPRKSDYIQGQGIRCLSSKVIDPFLLKLDRDTHRIVEQNFSYIDSEYEKQLLITPYFFGTDLKSLKRNVLEVAIKPIGFIADGNAVLLIPLKAEYFFYYQFLLNSKFCNYVVKKYILNYSIRDITIRDSTLLHFPIRYPEDSNVFTMLAAYLNFFFQVVYEYPQLTHIELMKLKDLSDSLVYELYFKEKFHSDGLYPEPKEYLLELVSKHLKPINYERWSELYWKKQLEGNLTPKEEKELEKLEKENLKIIEEVYTALIKDKEIEEQVERIKEHEWMKVIEEDKK